MRKLTIQEVDKIERYYCSKHNAFHNKFYSKTVDGKKQQLHSRPFRDCKEFAYELTNQEKFTLKFRKAWYNYDIKEHMKTRGSKKQ